MLVLKQGIESWEQWLSTMNKYYYYPHFIVKKNEAKRGEVLWVGHSHSSKPIYLWVNFSWYSLSIYLCARKSECHFNGKQGSGIHRMIYYSFVSGNLLPKSFTWNNHFIIHSFKSPFGRLFFHYTQVHIPVSCAALHWPSKAIYLQ